MISIIKVDNLKIYTMEMSTIPRRSRVEEPVDTPHMEDLRQGNGHVSSNSKRKEVPTSGAAHSPPAFRIQLIYINTRLGALKKPKFFIFSHSHGPFGQQGVIGTQKCEISGSKRQQPARKSTTNLDTSIIHLYTLVGSNQNGMQKTNRKGHENNLGGGGGSGGDIYMAKDHAF